MSSELYLELLDGLKSKKPKTFLALARTGQMVLTDRLRKKFKEASFFDFCESPTSGVITAELTTLEDQGLVIFKDLGVASIFEESILEMYQAIFNNREIVLTLANGKKKSTKLTNFHIIVICGGTVTLPESLVDTFDQVLKEDDDCEVLFNDDEGSEIEVSEGNDEDSDPNRKTLIVSLPKLDWTQTLIFPTGWSNDDVDVTEAFNEMSDDLLKKFQKVAIDQMVENASKNHGGLDAAVFLPFKAGLKKFEHISKNDLVEIRRFLIEKGDIESFDAMPSYPLFIVFDGSLDINDHIDGRPEYEGTGQGNNLLELTGGFVRSKIFVNVDGRWLFQSFSEYEFDTGFLNGDEDDYVAEENFSEDSYLHPEFLDSIKY